MTILFTPRAYCICLLPENDLKEEYLTNCPKMQSQQGSFHILLSLVSWLSHKSSYDEFPNVLSYNQLKASTFYAANENRLELWDSLS